MTDAELIRKLEEIEEERKKLGLPVLHSRQAIKHVEGCEECKRSEHLAREVADQTLMLQRSRAPSMERKKLATELLDRLEPGRRLALAKDDEGPLVTYEYDKIHKVHRYKDRNGETIAKTKAEGGPLGPGALRKMFELEEHRKAGASSADDREAKKRVQAAEDRKARHDKAIAKILKASGPPED